ncbi:hypothetical protein LINPERPRIM_LOCUS816 [Linum perenne]
MRVINIHGAIIRKERRKLDKGLTVRFAMWDGHPCTRTR